MDFLLRLAGKIFWGALAVMFKGFGVSTNYTARNFLVFRTSQVHVLNIQSILVFFWQGKTLNAWDNHKMSFKVLTLQPKCCMIFCQNILVLSLAREREYRSRASRNKQEEGGREKEID